MPGGSIVAGLAIGTWRESDEHHRVDFGRAGDLDSGDRRHNGHDVDIGAGPAPVTQEPPAEPGANARARSSTGRLAESVIGLNPPYAGLADRNSSEK
jgi:hypothetical protein